ncbi:unnamed protein product [Clonostachys rosea f. rosea IK726]|uniref:Uncharacterized protein n=1 Tax=Clonostachys rosea f. rosea IK726 TaxID=1349383 RepID=A0ACA9UPX8_BIOOC|nr:unnamed protein product [Clonostachys rosea f. rosea IK726]
MTTTAAPMDVPDDGIACDAPTNDVPPPRQPNNDNTRGETSGRWTPEPQPATFDTFTEWGSRHFGEEWTTERESMMNDAYNSIAAWDPTTSKRYCERQKELRDMERELQRGKVELIGRELDELTSLARKRYGEGWYLNRRAARREKEMGCAAKEFSEKMHHSLRTKKRWQMASDIMEARDEAMLSDGYSWEQILGSSQPPNATDDTETCTPAMSEVNSPRAATEASSELEDDDAPTNESEYAKEAREGPKHGTVEKLEWRAVAGDWDDERYERARFYGVGTERSRAENEECTRRYRSEGPKARKKREEMEAHFFRVQYQAIQMLMEHDGLDEDPRFNNTGRYRYAEARLHHEFHGGDTTTLPDLELIAQKAGIRRSLPEHHDGLSSGSGQEPTARPKQQQRKRPGSPQHHERRQSRRLRQLPVEYKPEDPDKIIRLANAARRRGL